MLRTLAPLFLCVCLTAHASAQALSLDLVSTGPPRALPERILGASVESFWQHIIDDPQRVAAVKSLHAAYTRFPGGTQSNYYDWKSGQLVVEPKPDSAAGLKLLNKFAGVVAKQFPEGISFEQYKAFSDAIGAEVVLVPNLETASVEDQVQWFKRLSAKGALPPHIELGNEFWIATGMDPQSLSRLPDEPASMRIMRQYRDAIQPYLPKGAKVAVQAAGASFETVPESRRDVIERLRQWDDALKPEPWFDAVTIHLYPRISTVLGRVDAVNDPMTPQTAQRNLRALMARVDDGTDSVLRELARRLPGKEIWVTEWNPRAGETVVSPNQTQPTTPAMQAHLVTRMAMAILRHPEVTVSLYFAISFLPKAEGPDRTDVEFLLGNPRGIFVEGEGGYQPLPVALVLKWLNEAANGGVTLERFLEPGSPRIPGGGVRQETYAAVEAALFRDRHRATMILQNVSSDARLYRIGKNLKLAAPSSVERLLLPDLDDTKKRAGQVEAVKPSLSIPVPPYSVTRIVWNLR